MTTTDTPTMHDNTDRRAPELQVFRIYIQAPAQKVWDALTSSEFSVKYGYGGEVHLDLTPGGDYRNDTTAAMKEMGMGDVAVTGRILEVEPPTKLVQTWVAAWHNEETTLTWDLKEYDGGLTRLTLTHDCTGAQNTARDIEGTGDADQGGGGWPWVLASIKTLLETGQPMVGAGA